MTFTNMDPKQISNLAKLLRASGDKVLNSDFKLSLSGPLLRALNDSFSLIADKHEQCGPQTFQVVKPYHSKSDVFPDLQLIHDFVQKIRILSLICFYNDEPFDDIIDIGKFRNLKILEIQRIPIQQISGLQQLRSQLQELICVRCTDTIKSIITDCGNDQTHGFIWNELKKIDFSYNKLKEIDCSLEFAPWLQILNLSHNQITSVHAVRYLPNLKILNLGYNRLVYIPQFHLDSVKHLQTLILTNNCIEDLSGISRLDALKELDLSDNCLLDHSNLLPISTLIALHYINLMGNPLYCHPKHRQATARYLHKNTTSVKFMLDANELTKSEKLLTGQYHSYQAILTARIHSHNNSNNGRSQQQQQHAAIGHTIPTIYNTGDRTPNNSVGSTSSLNRRYNKDKVKTSETDLISQTTILQQQQQQQQHEQQQQRPQQRKPKTRCAIIADNENEPQNILKSHSPIKRQSNKKSMEKIDVQNQDDNGNNGGEVIDATATVTTTAIQKTDHLETKKQIENLREQYGDDWLRSQGAAANMVQSVIGISKNNNSRTNENNQILNIINKNLHINSIVGDNAIDDDADYITDKQNNIMLSSTPIENSEQFLSSTAEFKSIMLDNDDNNKTGNFNNNNINSDNKSSINEDNNNSNINDKTIYKSSIDYDADNQLDKIFSISANAVHKSAQQQQSEVYISDAEDNEHKYIVICEPFDIEIFLIVSDLSIKEKDILSAQTKTKWTLKSLISCERLKSNVLHITFDTIRKDKKERTYHMDDDKSCHKLEQFLRGILSKRPLSEMNQTIYRCANCTTQFSRENIYKKQNIDIFCPECKSSYVIEIKETSYSRSIDKSTMDTKFIENIIGAGKSIVSTTTSTVATTTTTSSSSTATTTSKMHTSASHSSIGSANSLNESSSCSKLSNPESSFDSNQSIAGSSNCDDRDLDFSTITAQNKNCDSDVEILSNPSQSSIEVLLLMDSSVNSSRKHSEERRISQIPELDTISDVSSNLINNSSSLNNNNNQLQQSITPTTTKTTITTLKNDKLKTLPNINLTESSSSGSVTDSVCTSYEQQQSNNNNNNGIQNKSSTSTTFTDDNKTINSPDKLPKTDVSVISSMLGGLFQSTNLLMSKTPKNDNNNKSGDIDSSTTTSTPVLTEPFKFDYLVFNNVDHRLKLYFYQHLFEDDNEHLICLIKGLLIDTQQQEQPELQFGEAFLIMSTTKAYILQCGTTQCDDISKWLKKQLSVTIDRIQMIRMLPRKIGITVVIEGIGNFHLILQDVMRTDNCFEYLSDNTPIEVILDYVVDDIDDNILKFTKDEILYDFVVLNSCTISSNSGNSSLTTETSTDNKINNIINIKFPILIITDKHLYLTTNFKWMLLENGTNCDNKISSLKSIMNHYQLMSNVMDIIEGGSNTSLFSIKFMDESQDNSETWQCSFETINCVMTTFQGITKSWEILFGIPFGNIN